ncbi:hypothetical protein [Cutibacterium acnes]|uniref:hypothetical protein n=1 Tax=Cutibacterium acnes TaxID=1747 RepID=UPI00211D1773
MNADFSSLPTGLQIGIAALTVLEFVLLLLAVVVNLKTPESRLTLPRVAWLAISILIQCSLAPLAFLLAGRRREQPPVTTAGASKATAATAIDELYK